MSSKTPWTRIRPRHIPAIVLASSHSFVLDSAIVLANGGRRCCAKSPGFVLGQIRVDGGRTGGRWRCEEQEAGGGVRNRRTVEV